MNIVEYLEELANRLKKGEWEAFIEFCDYFGPRIYWLFIRYGMSKTEARDLAASCVHDTLLIVYERYEKRDGAGFATFVFSIAVRIHASWCRKNIERLSREEELREYHAAPQFAAEKTEQEVVRDERIADALSKLPPNEREVIILKYFAHTPLTSTEIGAMLGLKPGTVRVYQHRGLEMLKELLGNILQDGE